MKPFSLSEALSGKPIKVIGVGNNKDDKKYIIGKSKFYDEKYIIEDDNNAYTITLDRLKKGFEMWED